jgi:DNA-binding CsgD family transcriptional regulator
MAIPATLNPQTLDHDCLRGHAFVCQSSRPGHQVLDRRHATSISAGATASIDIGGQLCKLVCVDDVLPQHKISRNGGRPRFIYAADEVAHFDLGGHRYALVVETSLTASTAPRDKDSTSLPTDIRELLTNRELQIVQLISMGCLTKQAAQRLRISEFTVRSYLKTIYCKLGVRSRGAMVYRYAQAFKRSAAET